jgi:hydroxyacylglutathione hydrolase
MEGFILADLLKNGALVIDARAVDAQSDSGHVPGALHIPASDKFSTYAGWFVDYSAPTYLITAPEQVDSLVTKLRGIGVDDIPGYFTSNELGDLNADLPTVSPEQAARYIQHGALPLDVRERNEYDSEHIAGALHIPYGRLKELLASLPQDQAILIYCGSGVRSQIAASLLLKYGIRDFASLRGGLTAWKQVGLPVTHEKTAS